MKRFQGRIPLVNTFEKRLYIQSTAHPTARPISQRSKATARPGCKTTRGPVAAELRPDGIPRLPRGRLKRCIRCPMPASRPGQRNPGQLSGTNRISARSRADAGGLSQKVESAREPAGGADAQISAPEARL